MAKIDELRGEIPIGFVVIKTGFSAEGMEKELVALIRKQIGPVASFQHVLIVDKLPKTRSGKILRNILRKIIEGEEYRFPSTIEDADVLAAVKETVRKYGKGLGEKKGLVYRTDVDKLDREQLEQLGDEENISDKVEKKVNV